ncbi:MAG TPA: cytochrome c peroxidase [Chitinophagales bacterium]|nr:cytochrome c peroxidase [Chitinophagales bacterium]
MSVRAFFFFALFAGVVGFATGCSVDPSLEPDPEDAPHSHPFDLNVKPGLPPMPIPANNSLTVEGVALGRKLFYDPILSGDNTMSCGTCHKQSFAFTDSTLQLSTGIDGLVGTRNTMPLFNLGWQKKFFWDGGAASLEDQAIAPIENPVEMHESLVNCIAELQAHAEYPALFEQAFGSSTITTPMLMKAIAQFERTMVSDNSKYDQYLRGQSQLTSQELNGLSLYVDEGKGDCVHCHTLGSTFSDFEFRNNGLDSIPVDEGRYLITLNDLDKGKFKTPSLRNVEVTAPYMHDGRFSTLEEVLHHYNSDFHVTTLTDPVLQVMPKNRMSQQEMDDVIAFLKTLTDHDFLTNPAFAKP